MLSPYTRYTDTSISKSKNFCEPLKKQNFKRVKNSVLFYSRNSCVQYTVEERHSYNKRYLSTVHAKNHMAINLQIQTQNPHAKPDCIMMATFVSLLEERSYVFNVLMMFISNSKGTPRRFFYILLRKCGMPGRLLPEWIM
jgi:hypothetical protein